MGGDENHVCYFIWPCIYIVLQLHLFLMFTFHLCVHFTLVCGTVRVTTFDKLEPTLYFVDLLEETLDKYMAIHVYAMLSKIHPGTETTFKYIDSNNV